MADRISTKEHARIKREKRELKKDILNGISILNNKLETFDCAIISSKNSKVSDNENLRRFTKLQYQSVDKGYLDFVIKANSKESKEYRVPRLYPEDINNSVQCLVDFKENENLEKLLISWAKEYEQGSVLFSPVEGNAVEIEINGETVSKREITGFNKLTVCSDYIGKLLEKPFKFEDALIQEFPQPVNIMGKWYFNSLAKSL